MFLIISALLGCASTTTPGDSSPQQPMMGESLEGAGAATEVQAPLIVRVVKEINDGKELHVVAEIESKVAWPIDSVNIRLAGLRSGEEVVAKEAALTELTGRPAGTMMQAGQKLQFTASVPSASLTDYHLEVLWYETPAASAPQEALIGDAMEPIDFGSDTLVVQNLQITPRQRSCSIAPCGIEFELFGELVNKSPNNVREATLAVGFIRKDPAAAIDLSPGIPENEDLVEVAELNLAPGEMRSIRLVFDRAIPARDAQNYIPSVRVVAVKP